MMRTGMNLHPSDFRPNSVIKKARLPLEPRPSEQHRQPEMSRYFAGGLIKLKSFNLSITVQVHHCMPHVEHNTTCYVWGSQRS